MVEWPLASTLANQQPFDLSLSNYTSVIICRQRLVLGRVSGDVIDHFSPTVPLGVSYNGRRVMNGADLRPSAVLARPRVEIGGTGLRLSYTFVKWLYTTRLFSFFPFMPAILLFDLMLIFGSFFLLIN
jgi:hypothetical protein